MQLVLDIALGLFTAPLILLLAVLVAEVSAAVFGPGSVRIPESNTHPRVTVIIPAHNEESSVGRAISGIVPHLRPGDRCLVVADNCTDRTAAVATAAGAEVLERSDAAHRGKGYALAYAVAHLRSDPPDVAAVVDADCAVVPGSLGRLAAAAAATCRPVQGGNALFPPAGAGLRDRLSAFAFGFKNHVRATGLRNLGGPSLVFGTGMAFPWTVLAARDLATGDAVEDIRLGVELALARVPAWYAAEPCVSGFLPDTAAEAAAQRRRWEHGHIRTLLSQAPRLLAAGIARGRLGLILLGCDLAIPPLSMLFLLCLAATGVNTAAYVVIGTWFWLAALAAAQAAAGLALMAAWRWYAREWLPLTDLAQVPNYVFAKLPLYLAAIRPQRTWDTPTRV